MTPEARADLLDRLGIGQCLPEELELVFRVAARRYPDDDPSIGPHRREICEAVSRDLPIDWQCSPAAVLAALRATAAAHGDRVDPLVGQILDAWRAFGAAKLRSEARLREANASWTAQGRHQDRVDAAFDDGGDHEW